MQQHDTDYMSQPSDASNTSQPPNTNPTPQPHTNPTPQPPNTNHTPQPSNTNPTPQPTALQLFHSILSLYGSKLDKIQLNELLLRFNMKANSINPFFESDANSRPDIKTLISLAIQVFGKDFVRNNVPYYREQLNTSDTSNTLNPMNTIGLNTTNTISHSTDSFNSLSLSLSLSKISIPE